MTNIPTEKLKDILVTSYRPIDAMELAYLDGFIAGMEYSKSIFLKEKSEEVDQEELKEALSYFHQAGKYGFGIETDDLSESEIVEKYKEALRREMDIGDIDINLSNEQVT